MRVLVCTYGSRGDTEPYVALACALNAAGHEAVLAAPSTYAGLAARHGVEFAARDAGLLNLIHDPRLRRQIEDGRATGRHPDLALEIRDRLFPAHLTGLLEAAADADLVVHRADYGHHVAEKIGVPSVLGLLNPHGVASAYYPTIEALGTEAPRPRADGPSRENLRTHVRARLRGEPAPTRKCVEQWRERDLGLPPRAGMHDRFHQVDNRPVPVLHAFSRHLVEPAPDWPPWVHTTGYWFLPTDRVAPPPRLVRFLEQGAPPVFFGLGSLVGTDPRRTGRMVVEATRRVGVRAVVVAGAGGIAIDDPETSDDVLVVDDVPYDWLFPRVRAAVHAGGLGTTHHALAAGLPQVALPFHVEQMSWATHLHARGVAPPPIWQRDLSTTVLSTAVRACLTDPARTRAAQALGRNLRSEGGATAAVEVLEAIHGPRLRRTGEAA
ncbi:glycosyltransferase [Micromonospora foliorum]|uniref:glycosyltransferase n=1 Tax=Micromonospora foliorum TaxID=2911210 RepID=UPI001EE7867C|nr:glycosyltransferase [Micromonospora foliorum]MCG5435257.1 glycosyltransferase [Micromonospora foliorum]